MSLSSTRFGGNAPGLPRPVPLPPISAALSRRAAMFGAMTVAAVPLTIPPATAASPADTDRCLAVMAADICSTLDGAAYAFDPVEDEDGQDRRLGRANDVTLDMVALPAVGLAGVLAKAKAYLDSNSYDVLHLAELADSLAEDVERVLEGRVA